MPRRHKAEKRLKVITTATHQNFGQRLAAILRDAFQEQATTILESVPKDHLEHSDHGNGDGVNTPSSANPTGFGDEVYGNHIASHRYHRSGKSIRFHSRSRLRARHTRKPVVRIAKPQLERKVDVMSDYFKRLIVIERFVRVRLVYLSYWIGDTLRVFPTRPAFASGYATVHATTPNWSVAIGAIKSAMSLNAAASLSTAKADVIDYGTAGFARDEDVTTSKSAANDGAGEAKRDRSNDWKNLQLWVDAVTEAHLRELAEAVEAASLSELIRRALRAREDFRPDESTFADTITPFKAGRDNARRITVTLPSTSVERVERLKKATGKDFRTLVYEAVLVFAELNERSKGEDNIKLY